MNFNQYILTRMPLAAWLLWSPFETIKMLFHVIDEFVEITLYPTEKAEQIITFDLAGTSGSSIYYRHICGYKNKKFPVTIQLETPGPFECTVSLDVNSGHYSYEFKNLEVDLSVRNSSTIEYDARFGTITEITKDGERIDRGLHPSAMIKLKRKERPPSFMDIKRENAHLGINSSGGMSPDDIRRVGQERPTYEDINGISTIPPSSKLKRKDIPMLDVLAACWVAHNNGTGLTSSQLLMRKFNAPVNLVLSAIKRDEKGGLIEGSDTSPYVTPKGRNILSQHYKLPTPSWERPEKKQSDRKHTLEDILGPLR